MSVSNDENALYMGDSGKKTDSPKSYFDSIPRWKRTLLIFIMGLGGILTMVILRKINDKKSEKRKLREKVRYFKPTIVESSWSKEVRWEMRDKPLTDDELDAFEESHKKM